MLNSWDLQGNLIWSFAISTIPIEHSLSIAQDGSKIGFCSSTTYYILNGTTGAVLNSQSPTINLYAVGISQNSTYTIVGGTNSTSSSGYWALFDASFTILGSFNSYPPSGYAYLKGIQFMDDSNYIIYMSSNPFGPYEIHEKFLKFSGTSSTPSWQSKVKCNGCSSWSGYF